MSRKLYETQADRDNEREIIDQICAARGCEAYKLPFKYRMDFAMVKGGKVTALVEVKNRNCASFKYPNFMISLDKIIHANNLTMITHLPCWLAVRWTDCIGLVDFEMWRDISLGGRFDRGDPDDFQLQGYFNIKDFVKI